MFSIKSLAVTTAVVSLFSSATASFDISAKTNVAVYYGQGANQARLRHFCEETDIDVIPIGFVNFFPQDGNGWPGDNFGNQCWGTVYTAPGYNGVNNPANNQLQNECPNIAEDIPYCQSLGKKIVLSLGGGFNTYHLDHVADAAPFADFMWGAFGPKDPSWTGPRPFDTTLDPSGNPIPVSVDGFDFDIEFAAADGGLAYIAMINQLRSHFPSDHYIITGAPQCKYLSDPMTSIIAGAKFDILWIQFYNTWGCSARDWINANPNYESNHIEAPSGFSYDGWSASLAGGASANAKLYIGTLGSQSATTVDPAFYLNPFEVTSLAEAYFCHPNFGGIMIWEATTADANQINGTPFYSAIKKALTLLSHDTTDLSCAVASTTSVSSTSTTSTSSSTSATFDPTTSTTTSATTSSSISTTNSVNLATGASSSTTTTGSSSATSSTSATSAIGSSSSSTKAATSTPFYSNSTTTSGTKGPASATSSSASSSSVSANSQPATITSTYTTTNVYTISSCAPTVTNCPLGKVTTETVLTTTTFCPASTNAPGGSGSGPAGGANSGPSVTKYTTSTVYTTTTYTVTSCPGNRVHCPALGMVTTETKSLYTTVCPVAAAATASNTPVAPGTPKMYTSVVVPVNSTTPVAPVTVLQTKIVVPTPVSPAGITTIATVPVAAVVPSVPAGGAGGAGGVKVVGAAGPSGAGAASGTGVAKPTMTPFTGAAAPSMKMGLGWGVGFAGLVAWLVL